MVNSLAGFGENEKDQEKFLQGLNAARKNSLVKCNLQYVLSLLRGLGEPEEGSAVSTARNSQKNSEKNGIVSPRIGSEMKSVPNLAKQKSERKDIKDIDDEDKNWQATIQQYDNNFMDNLGESNVSDDNRSASKKINHVDRDNRDYKEGKSY